MKSVRETEYVPLRIQKAKSSDKVKHGWVAAVEMRVTGEAIQKPDLLQKDEEHSSSMDYWHH